MRPEPELADDRRAEPPDGLGHGRRPDARRELERVGDPADPLAALDDEDPDAGPGEVGRRDQPVVAGADDDRVVGGWCRAGAHRQAAFRPRALSTSIAAIRPLAPMIPPPGWVDEPPSHRSRTGLLNRA